MAKNVLTPTFRVSFPKLKTPEAYLQGKPKFSVVMLFDKTEDLTELKKLAQDALNSKWPDKTKRPKGLKNPFRDGDVEKPDVDGYAGKIFITASSLQRPGCVDQKRKIYTPDEAEIELYAGSYARAQVTAYAFDAGANKGVAFGLQHIQKVKDGDAFNGRMNVNDAFEVIEGEDDPFAEESGSSDLEF